MTSGPIQPTASRTVFESREQERASGEWRRLCERYGSADDLERRKILTGLNGERLQLFDLAWRGFYGNPLPIPEQPARRGLLARIWSLLA